MADILLVDMQSFYASVEKRKRLISKAYVIVSGDPERRSGVVLAACPLAKRYGVKCRTAVGSAYQMSRRRYCPSADAAVY